MIFHLDASSLPSIVSQLRPFSVEVFLPAFIREAFLLSSIHGILLMMIDMMEDIK